MKTKLQIVAHLRACARELQQLFDDANAPHTAEREQVFAGLIGQARGMLLVAAIEVEFMREGE